MRWIVNALTKNCDAGLTPMGSKTPVLLAFRGTSFGKRGMLCSTDYPSTLNRTGRMRILSPT
jgi:hypothetical protein